MKKFSNLYVSLLSEATLATTGPKLSWDQAKQLFKKKGVRITTYSNPATRAVYFHNGSKNNIMAFLKNRINPKTKYEPAWRTNMLRVKIPYLSDYKPVMNAKQMILTARKNKTRLTSKEEAAILQSGNPATALKYAQKVVKGRWPEGEPLIAINMDTLYKYADTIIKGRWPEGEQMFIQALKDNKKWAKSSIQNGYYFGLYLEKYHFMIPWPEIVPFLKQERDSVSGRLVIRNLCIYAAYTGTRIPWLEKHFLNPESDAFDYAVKYTANVLKKRWPKLEQLLLGKDILDGVEYALKVIKGRWSELEQQLQKDKKSRNDWVRDHAEDAWEEYMDDVVIGLQAPVVTGQKGDADIITDLI